uniref:Protein TIC 214 n=1 Tax=Linnaeosicyos amara TaxID=386243 RepID=A0A6H0ETK3_9ROSI|nr:Ycf1 protein [Linnaeosicyos amara]YP_009752221.1 Ycf1 protein [Linnaeosicyos amara]QIT05614.1 Ycf1 protein [Linnaeosicyos amara]QIT05631.1 Ycf1 protein [Linnaeosicyos amara]
MMILKSFILGNLVSLCMKIINSVVVVGLYYGFLTTFSIGPSYLFLLRARVMEEGTEKKVSATTGFITGQLMMFISIYYAPLHLALGRPHTITVLALPYLLFHFFWNNHKNFFDYGSTTRNSMRNLSIQCVFLNNLIFPLFNHFILPSSMLVRLVNISMFRCNNKMLFVTSSFVGWLIGHILFMKWVGLILVWIQQNNSIRSNVLIRSNKYPVSELRNSMARIFSILLFITCVYYLGRIPSPIFTKKLKTTSETEESEEETDVEIETTSEKREEDTSPSLFSEEKEDPDKQNRKRPVYETSYPRDGNKKNSKLQIHKKAKSLFWFEKPLVTILFDYKRWNRPFRYIKKDKLENAVRTEMSQYFFSTCKSDGKDRIVFTHPPSVSTFFEMIQKKISLFITEKLYYDELDNPWNYLNEQKKINLNKKFLNRIQVLDKGSLTLARDVLEKRTQLCNDKTKKYYLPKTYDPLLSGPYRNRIYFLFLFGTRNETSIKKDSENVSPNKIHAISLNTNYPQIEDKIESEDRIKSFQFLFDPVRTPYKAKARRQKLREIIKNVPRWSSELITELEQREGKNRGRRARDHQIRSRRFGRTLVFYEKLYPGAGEREKYFVREYFQEPDFRRDIIKGSMRAQRRKTITWQLVQANAHSHLFFERLDNSFFSPFDILKGKLTENQKKAIYRIEKEMRMATVRRNIVNAWNKILFGQVIRSLLLITQSILRKYIVLPSLIIAKNILCMLLFEVPEWSEDFQNWNKEMHVKCTFNGGDLSEKEFRKNWLRCLREGIQIKIFVPFRLKPWHTSRLQSPNKDSIKKKGQKNTFYFLTVFGMETKVTFGFPRKQRSRFEPIFKKFIKELEKKIKKWVIKNRKQIRNELSQRNLFELKEIYELNEAKNAKNSIISNRMIQGSSSLIRSMDWTNFSLRENKMKDLTDITNTILKKIEKIRNDTKKEFLNPEINISPNKISYDDKILESQKNIFKILKKRNVRLIRKSHHFLKFFVENIYIDILQRMINIPRINVQLFIDSITIKNNLTKSISNNEANQERIDKTNQSIIHFISTIKKSLSNISNKNRKIFWDLSYLSQAYLFYKLSQTQIINLSKLRPVFQYHGTSLFLKNEIQDYFVEVVGAQEILHSDLKQKNLPNSGMNQWKNWLIFYKKQNSFETHYSLRNKKENFKKKYRYDLLSYKSINYEDNKDSYISELPVQVKNNQESSYKYNTDKRKFDDIIDLEKNTDRKYFDWRMLHFSLKNTKTGVNNLNNFQLIEKIDNQDFFVEWVDFLILINCEIKKIFFDWMRMNEVDWMTKNEEILCRWLSNRGFWFFPEFCSLYEAYQINPWIIPIKSLLLNLNGNEIFSKNKNLIGNTEEKESVAEEDLESALSNHKNYVQEDEESITKMEDEIDPETGLDFLRKRGCQFKRHLYVLIKMAKFSNTYCLLARSLNRKETILSCIQRKELSISLVKLGRNLTFSEFVKGGILIIEPLRRSVKNDGQFIMSQTIGISLVSKNKYQINQRYQEKGYPDKKSFAESIAIHQKTNENRTSNHYDLLVPENILSPRGRREFRILICFNSRNRNDIHRNTAFYNANKVKTDDQGLDKRSKHLDRYKNKLNKLKFFLWPNYRLEDLACMNRYWFDTNNSSRFSMLRIHMYPQLKIR